MPTTRLAYLFQCYFKKTATEAETAELMRLLALKENEAEVQDLMAQAWEAFGNGDSAVTEGPFTSDQSAAMLRHALDVLDAGHTGDAEASGMTDMAPVRKAQGVLRKAQGMPPKARGVLRMDRFRVAAAAVVLLVMGSGVWWLGRPHTPTGPAPVSHRVASFKKGDIGPGGNKAVLTLGNGSVITLDSIRKGTLALQGHTQVLQVGGGQLAYRAAETGISAPAPPDAEPSFNTIATPRGGQYRVTLPDGSKVWLNAASSLRFPTAFTGKDREVELTGEAYFEVAGNRNQPFCVRVNNMRVNVLGTHFNVMAYEDEGSVNTSLLQGSVRVVQGEKSRLLMPGEEAGLDRLSGELSVTLSDTDRAVAWKNGLFLFEGATIGQVMRQLARWYDIEVNYEGNIPTHYSGGFSRNATLSEVLDMLQLGVRARFVLDGKTVTVRPL